MTAPATPDPAAATPPAPGGAFPHPAYARYVLGPAFEESRAHLFGPMMEANTAHTVMLTETGILDSGQAAPLLGAIRTVRVGGAAAFAYAPAVEDLFFAVEGRLIALTSPEIGGNLQIARSRNDLAAGMSRMLLRGLILRAERQALALRRTLLALAERHAADLMPGITHTQPAQPTTLGHYLLGAVGPLERDSARLRAAYHDANRSPLGVAAFTTTSFPIDRELTAALLGFEGLVENGYDAVGASDHLLEATHALTTMVSSLSRLLYDLLIWTRHEVGVLRIADEFIQISSIMPQKRNPVVLEHIRVRIGWVYGDASTVATIAHSAALGDTNDVEDPMFLPLVRCFASAEAVLTLLDAALATATFNTATLAARAGDGNTTTTALADALVQDHGLPFRTAHHIVARLVRGGAPIDAAAVNTVATDDTGGEWAVTDEWVGRVLDPAAFVAARNLPGGPGPAAMAGAITSARQRIADDGAAIDRAEAALDAATVERDRRADGVISAG